MAIPKNGVRFNMDLFSYLLGKNSGGGGEFNAKLDVTASYDVGTNTNGVTTLITKIDSLDTSSMTNGEYLFKGCTHLESIPNIDTSNITSLYYAFYNCSSLTSIPELDTTKVTTLGNCFSGCSKITSIPQLNTPAVANFSSFVNGCTALTTIPLMDTHTCTNMKNFAANCPNLSDESLDNILQMCAGVSLVYMQTKTLVDVGIKKTVYSQSKIESLPHYQDFIDAGWTTGY